jgi:UDP-galactopyranose mutase
VPAPLRVAAWQPVVSDSEATFRSWREIYTELVAQVAPSSPRTVLWFFTPTPTYVLPRVQSGLVVYDVMDDLSAFRGAARDLRDREEHLLQRADIVFAAGRSLAASRRGVRGDIELLPSAVDATHFRRPPAATLPPPVRALRRPVLTWCGVIDERVDLDLVARVADARPDWSLLMVGPTAKIDEADLPRRPNVYYPGALPYGHLPSILQASDVCIMPFALTEATASISPTKTLEYLAAGRPVVSTPVADVVAEFDGTVEIAAGIGEFVRAVERVLGETRHEARERRQRAAAAASLRDWDGVCARITELITSRLSHIRDRAVS